MHLVWVALSRQLGMQKFTTDEFKDVKGSFITELSNIGFDQDIQWQHGPHRNHDSKT